MLLACTYLMYVPYTNDGASLVVTYQLIAVYRVTGITLYSLV